MMELVFHMMDVLLKVARSSRLQSSGAGREFGQTVRSIAAQANGARLNFAYRFACASQV
ncbi:hypothetical protein ACP70R_033864 [Stipagrostis hirtigluma subsp. patula]